MVLVLYNTMFDILQYRINFNKKCLARRHVYIMFYVFYTKYCIIYNNIISQQNNLHDNLYRQNLRINNL